MRRPTALVLLAAAGSSQAVRLQAAGGQAAGIQDARREVAPGERHLQYLYQNLGGGLHDRLTTFTWLLRLGLLHNATTHINGGDWGAQLFLNPKHSRKISPFWGAYFDTRANGGNPFHTVLDLPGCRTVSDPATDLSTLFDGDVTCVNLKISMFAFKHKIPPGLPAASIPPSRRVVQEAQRVRGRLPGAYGAIHIRRCDLLGEGHHKDCTAVESVYKQMAKYNDYQAWFISLYVEPGYREELAKRLKPLGRQIVFEDEKELNPVFPGDNYFTLAVANEIKGNASLILDSHHCPGSTMNVIRGSGPVQAQYLWRLEDTAGPAVQAARSGEEVDGALADAAGSEAWEGDAFMDGYGATCEPGRP